MATPSSAERRFHARGAKKGTTWGTAVALGATDEILLTGASGLEPPDTPVLSALESDHHMVKHADLGLTPAVDFTIPVYGRYEMGRFGTLLCQLFGTAGAPAQQAATAAYKHTILWAEEIEGLFSTYAEERPSQIYEVPSAKPYKLSLSFAEGLLAMALAMRGNNCINTSTTNTATQLDALTLPASFLETRIKFSQAAVKINTEAGGDVASETALVLSDFKVDIERPVEAGVHVAGSGSIIEPLEEGQSGPACIIELNFPRMSSVNNPFLATFLAGTAQKMSIVFTGALIESTYYYSLGMYFPRLRVLPPKYPDENIVKSTLRFSVEEAASNPTGMSDTTPYIELINKQTTDYLA